LEFRVGGSNVDFEAREETVADVYPSESQKMGAQYVVMMECQLVVLMA
jgi:hypothetical protein